MHYHPLNGKRFEEINDEKDAQEHVDILNAEVDALIEARKLSVDQLEVLGRVMIGAGAASMTTAELRRDMLIYAKKDPQGFLNAVSDPAMKLQSDVQKFFDEKLIAFRNSKERCLL